jgi:hypothetical protein
VWPYLLDGDDLAGVPVDGLVDDAKGAVADLLQQLVFRRRIHAVAVEWLCVPSSDVVLMLRWWGERRPCDLRPPSIC